VCYSIAASHTASAAFVGREVPGSCLADHPAIHHCLQGGLAKNAATVLTITKRAPTLHFKPAPFRSALTPLLHHRFYQWLMG